MPVDRERTAPRALWGDGAPLPRQGREHRASRACSSGPRASALCQPPHSSPHRGRTASVPMLSKNGQASGSWVPSHRKPNRGIPQVCFISLQLLERKKKSEKQKSPSAQHVLLSYTEVVSTPTVSSPAQLLPPRGPQSASQRWASAAVNGVCEYLGSVNLFCVSVSNWLLLCSVPFQLRKAFLGRSSFTCWEKSIILNCYKQIYLNSRCKIWT